MKRDFSIETFLERPVMANPGARLISFRFRVFRNIRFFGDMMPNANEISSFGPIAKERCVPGARNARYQSGIVPLQKCTLVWIFKSTRRVLRPVSRPPERSAAQRGPTSSWSKRNGLSLLYCGQTQHWDFSHSGGLGLDSSRAVLESRLPSCRD